MVVLLVALAAPGLGQGTSESETESKIVALEYVLNQAVNGKDLKALGSILDDRFIWVDDDGRLMSKTELLAYVRTFQGNQVAIGPVLVRVHGDTAVTSGIFRTNGIEHGKPFVLLQRFLDTWSFRNGVWMAIASLSTPVRS